MDKIIIKTQKGINKSNNGSTKPSLHKLLNQAYQSKFQLHEGIREEKEWALIDGREFGKVGFDGRW